MQLCEFKAVDPNQIEFQIVNRDGQRMREPMVFAVPDDAAAVRVEIHSLDPPWPADRPEGWGVGWWFRVGDQELISVRVCDQSKLVEGLDPATGNLRTYRELRITSYGPQVGVPG